MHLHSYSSQIHHTSFSLSKEGEGTKEQEGKRRRKKIGKRRSPRAAALYLEASPINLG